MILRSDAILHAADELAAGRGLGYRQRLRLERAVFRILCDYVRRLFDWELRSMSRSARAQFLAHCETLALQPTDPRLVFVNHAFEVMRLIASIANADPYVLNENISRVIHRYSTGVATLPLALRAFVASLSESDSSAE